MFSHQKQGKKKAKKKPAKNGIIFVFHCVAKNIKGMYFISDLYSQIWLNLPRDDCHFSTSSYG
jgi:hypothetical protein